MIIWHMGKPHGTRMGLKLTIMRSMKALWSTKSVKISEYVFHEHPMEREQG
jgi:hypothetical protein